MINIFLQRMLLQGLRTWFSSSSLCSCARLLQARKQPATAVASSRLFTPSSRSTLARVGSSVSRDSSACGYKAQEAMQQYKQHR